MKRKRLMLVQVNNRAIGCLFEEAGPKNGVGSGSFYFQLVVAGGRRLEIVEGNTVGADLEAGAEHADDLSLLQIGQQDDAIDGFFAGDLEHQIMIEWIRINRNFKCHNHSLWDFGVKA